MKNDTHASKPPSDLDAQELAFRELFATIRERIDPRFEDLSEAVIARVIEADEARRLEEPEFRDILLDGLSSFINTVNAILTEDDPDPRGEDE